MAAENAAILIPNAELSGERLAAEIRALLPDTARLEGLERNARRIAVLDAERRIVDLAEKAVSNHV